MSDLLLLVIFAGAILVLCVIVIDAGHRLDRLEKRVACLEHPAGGMSSTAIRLGNDGRFHVIQPPTATRICR
jgi:hypothetical protein